MKLRLVLSLAQGIAAALLLGSCAHATEPTWGLVATGLVAMPVAEGNEHAARFSIEPSLKWKGSGVEFRARVRARWAALQGNFRAEAEVREMSAAWRERDFSLTVGAQQLNWGRMDILRITDVINPVDQRDLFFEEMPEAKRALWMANLEWQHGPHTLQFVVTPQVPVDRLPDRLAGLPVSLSKPGSSFAHATWAARYGFEAQGWNGDIVAVRGWQATPSLRQVADATGQRLQGAVLRQHSLGVSADRPLGPTVLRVESVYAKLAQADAASDLGFNPRRMASIGAGLDIRAAEWFLAGQVVVQHDSGRTGPPDDRAFVSMIVQRKWLQDRLSVRGVLIQQARSGSAWSSLQTAYELSSNQVLRVQCDWFKGNPTEAFGSRRQSSRISAALVHRL